MKKDDKRVQKAERITLTEADWALKHPKASAFIRKSLGFIKGNIYDLNLRMQLKVINYLLKKTHSYLYTAVKA